MKVSACLIVRDEADVLARCLASLRNVADELVVVDTGSTDDTVKIAKAHHARLLHVDWRDDFAAARNVGLDVATGDWILVIDADEELIVEDRRAWRRALASRVDAYQVAIKNDLGDHYQTHRLCRLFRNRPAYRFEFRLHEVVEYAVARAGGVGATLAPAAGLLLHDGYLPDRVAMRDKRARNMRLAHLNVQDNPGDPNRWFLLGKAAFDGHHDPDTAIQAYSEAWRLLALGKKIGPVFFEDLAVAYADALYLYRNPEIAIKVLESASQAAPDRERIGRHLAFLQTRPETRAVSQPVHAEEVA